MKKVVLPMIVMTVLCAYSATMEEARQLVRESVKKLGEARSLERWAEIFKELQTLDDVRFSVYLEMMEENPDDPDTVNRLLEILCSDDGWDEASYGNQEALGWARKVLREEREGFNLQTAQEYLLLKGDARDMDIIGDVFRKFLAIRVAGTNLVGYYPLPNGEYINWFECFPSVTNTGPQGRYVFEILRQCWEKLEVEYHEGKRSHPFRDPSKIPAELLTMVVSFDADGNPVCNVDLAKYGLTMPELDVPVKPQAGEEGGADIPVCAQTHRQEFPNRGADSLRRLWLPSALIALTLLIGGIYARRKKLK